MKGFTLASIAILTSVAAASPTPIVNERDTASQVIAEALKCTEKCITDRGFSVDDTTKFCADSNAKAEVAKCVTAECHVSVTQLCQQPYTEVYPQTYTNLKGAVTTVTSVPTNSPTIVTSDAVRSVAPFNACAIAVIAGSVVGGMGVF